MTPVQVLLERIRAEFLEMPGLRLTNAQIQRLCGLETTQCALVLDSLVREKFLCRRPDGAYTRLTDGEDYPRPPGENRHNDFPRRKAS